MAEFEEPARAGATSPVLPMNTLRVRSAAERSCKVAANRSCPPSLVTERVRRCGRLPCAGVDPAPLVPAATVVVLRDRDSGPETLLLRRNAALVFGGGMWVFPGGRVDAGDRGYPGLADAELRAARRAAVREAREEAGLELTDDALVPIAHWTPPVTAPRRFATWFFVARAPSDAITVDFGEIHDHRWIRPADAIDAHGTREIGLQPPTWMTLHRLQRFTTADEALVVLAADEVTRYSTRIASVAGGRVALWAGDAGYEANDPDISGPRHRLVMPTEGEWTLEHTS
jgi:8-oxo-dGTP pyrophosphatase MutT (NUDIX family)